MSLFGKKKYGKILKIEPLKIHWDTEDPFVFASHHSDDYPQGNAQQAPPLDDISGRNLGRDYKIINGFRMYHGKVVPGFPAHVHWGYETITMPEIGFIDHFDALGNQGRYGFGDVQWITAGKRYQHCEMYPLAFSDRRNPNNITQIMLNLPLKDKDREPSFDMMWSENIPCVKENGIEVKIIAGSYGGVGALKPNSASWAADPDHHVNIFRISMEPNSSLNLPAVSPTLNRNLYFMEGSTASVDGEMFEYSHRVKLSGNDAVTVTNGDLRGEFWLLEGEPIGEKMSSFGPVILGSDKEVRAAMKEVREKEFEDWPWDVIDKAQPPGTERFVRYSDGSEEFPPGS